MNNTNNLETVSNVCSSYLSNHTFIPHSGGNSMNFGLNSFGCESIIKYMEDIWIFAYFIQNSNNAVYFNKNGQKVVLDSYEMHKLDITRMMEE